MARGEIIGRVRNLGQELQRWSKELLLIAISNASDTSKLAGNIWKLAQPTTSVLVVGKTLF